MVPKEQNWIVAFVSLIAFITGAALIALNLRPATSVVAARFSEEAFTPTARATVTLPLFAVNNTATPTRFPTPMPTATATPIPSATPSPTLIPPTPTLPSADISIDVDAGDVQREISPMIYGLSEASYEYMQEVRPGANSWGGNNSSRYNWRAGNLFNAAHDYEWRNGTYGQTGMVADQFISESNRADAAVRLSIPALGWVAKDDWSCGFPQDDGSCGEPIGDCYRPHPSDNVDPLRTSIPSTVDDIREWMQHINANDLQVKTIGFDNEPELWGYSHYDVHPDCTTYEEIRDKYIEYMTAVREVMPDVELAGPTTCCWWYYWEPAGGAADKLQYDNQDWLPWFLDQMRLYEEETGERILDVLDIHYYHPELFLVVDETDETRARRLRSTAALWDRSYVDESYINEPVYLMPRMFELIETHYPGTKFGLSEWNPGNDDEVNGALAIADTLGIFGREGLYYAYYWRFPDWGSPGFYAFKIFTNYDDLGGRFGDLSVAADSPDKMIAVHAAINSETEALHIMLINKNIDSDHQVELNLAGFSAADTAELYHYGPETPQGIALQIVHSHPDRVVVPLPAYSITHVVVQPAASAAADAQQ